MRPEDVVIPEEAMSETFLAATGPGGPMLLHAVRLVVPRAGKPAIDVTAALPDSFADWVDAA